ncbi:hypothetical protein Esti_005079 [Eimeria stiedai]
MGPRTLRAAAGMSLILVGVSRDSSAAAAPWSSSSSGSSSLETILHNAGLEVSPTQSLSVPEPAHHALDLFPVGAWLGAPLGLASQPLASYPSEVNRRLRPQPQVDLAGIDRSHQWLASLPGLGLMSSTAQLQRQQPQQERELAAAASRLANSVKTVRLTLTPTQRKAVETMIYALQTIRIESNRSVLGDYDRAVINQLTATASKSVEEVERFLNSYSELLSRLSSLGRALQSLSPPWEYTPSAPLAVAAASLHAAATDAAAAVSPDQEHPERTSSTTTTTTTSSIPTTNPNDEAAVGSSTSAAAAADAAEKEQAAAAAGESQETSLATPPPQPVVRSTAATTSARGGRQRNRRPSNAAESTSSSSSSSTSTSTAAPIDADEQEDEQELQEQQLQEQHLVKEVQHQLHEQQLQEQQLQQLQLQLQMQLQLQEQQQMQLQLQEQLHEQQQLQELQQLQKQFDEEENWRKVQQQRLQHMQASEEAAAMARLRALLRSSTYADLRAALGPYGPPVSLREAMAFKEFGDKLKVRGWGAGEIRRAAKKTSSTTEAFYAVAREVGLSKASVDALAPRMPTLLK